jgi:hypothetical protein
VKPIPVQSPHDPRPASLAGALAKVALRSIHGACRIGLTDDEYCERYDACENLARQLVSNCARKASEHLSWTLDFKLSRAREGVARTVACEPWDVSAAEERRVMVHVQQLLCW